MSDPVYKAACALLRELHFVEYQTEYDKPVIGIESGDDDTKIYEAAQVLAKLLGVRVKHERCELRKV